MSKSPPKKTNSTKAKDGVSKGGSDPRDYTLSEADAKAGGPADQSVAGEEDPGAGLEFLIKRTPREDRGR